MLKPVLGRYSERVAAGALASAEEWQAALDAAAASPADWVVQAFVPPRRRWLPSPAGGQPGYVNWGVYLAGGEPAEICPRFQPTPLTEDATVWWAPLVIRRERPAPPIVQEPAAPVRREMRGNDVGRTWQDIADRGALRGYTNAWTDGLANFSLAVIALTPGAWDELGHATRVLGRAVVRVLDHLRGRPELLGVLGIPQTLAPLCAAATAGDEWSFLSRFDWAWTTDDRWKLLEINSDTPAGLWEAGSIEDEVAKVHRGVGPLSRGFWPALVKSWRGARSSARSAKVPRAAGCVSASSARSDPPKTRISCALTPAPRA